MSQGVSAQGLTHDLARPQRQQQQRGAAVPLPANQAPLQLIVIIVVFVITVAVTGEAMMKGRPTNSSERVSQYEGRGH